jgi:hypothetical protein
MTTHLVEATEDQIFDLVFRFFTENHWDFVHIEDRPILRMKYQGKHGLLTCYAESREKQRLFIFYSIPEIFVSEDTRQLMAEFLTRANYGLALGNFEMDFADGQVRYKTSLDVEGDRLTEALLKQMVAANVLTMDRYLPGILAVSDRVISPTEAIAQIET